MGRWEYSNRRTVEQCKSISTKFFKDKGYLCSNEERSCHGSIFWSHNGRSIGFGVSTFKGNEYINLKYTITDKSTNQKTEIDYNAKLTWTPCNFGGRRWWFICPLVVNGQICSRRVGVLYLASGKYFGCRHCYNLTYESCKESHKFDRLFRELGITEKQAKELFK